MVWRGACENDKGVLTKKDPKSGPGAPKDEIVIVFMVVFIVIIFMVVYPVVPDHSHRVGRNVSKRALTSLEALRLQLATGL